MVCVSRYQAFLSYDSTSAEERSKQGVPGRSEKLSSGERNNRVVGYPRRLEAATDPVRTEFHTASIIAATLPFAFARTQPRPNSDKSVFASTAERSFGRISRYKTTHTHEKHKKRKTQKTENTNGTQTEKNNKKEETKKYRKYKKYKTRAGQRT